MIAINLDDDLYYWHDGSWYHIGGSGSGFEFYQLTDTIASDDSSYQNDLLKNGKSVKSLTVNNQTYTTEAGDFTFAGQDIIDGVVRFITINLYAGDTITIPFNRKL